MKDPDDTSLLRRSAPGDADHSPTLDWVVSSGRVDRVFEAVEVRLRRRQRKWLGAVATGMAALLVMETLWLSPWKAPVVRDRVAPSTMVVWPVRQVLPDGSVVELKDGSDIAIEFTSELRQVALRRGEGHFEVVKDSSRPFVVVAGEIEVRAVGTAFAVALGGSAIEVWVTEGRVSVEESAAPASAAPVAGSGALPLPAVHEGASPAGGDSRSKPDGPARTLAFVDAGKRVVIPVAIDHSQETSGSTVLGVSTAEINDRLSWRVPRLEFSGTPLAQAVPMFNEHGRMRLVIGDASLGALELSGIMRADNTGSLLRLLRDEFGIRAVRRGDEIVLGR